MEEAVPLATQQPLNPAVPQYPHPEPTVEGVRHLLPRRTMNLNLNSTAQLWPSSPGSERTEAAAQLARHPDSTSSQPVPGKLPQAPAQEQPQKLAGSPFGEQSLGQPEAAGTRPQTVPPKHSAAGPQWPRTAP